MTAAARKREQRARDRTAVQETDDNEWSERVCLLVLSEIYADILKQAAWRRLGVIRGWET